MSRNPFFLSQSFSVPPNRSSSSKGKKKNTRENVSLKDTIQDLNEKEFDFKPIDNLTNNVKKLKVIFDDKSF
jgi:hypothetical protein